MSSISPITTLFPAASAVVAVSDANSSQAPSSNPVDFRIVSFPSFISEGHVRELPYRFHSPFVDFSSTFR
jgi:hypothetical protein